MAIKTFAAIDVGSYELALKIFEVNRYGMKEIDHVRHEIDMGTESYATGKLSYERVDELCRVLLEFSKIMKSYQVEDYVAYGTSAIRETKNTAILLNQIEVRCGIHIDVLSNSEQRFLDYKSVAFQGKGFLKLIENSSAIVDIGGGSIQISLFDNDKLVSTQNLKLGVLRLQESLHKVNAGQSQQVELVQELVDSQMQIYKKLYLRDQEVKNLIVVDDYLSLLLKKQTGKEEFAGTISYEMLESYEKEYYQKSTFELAKIWDMPQESMQMLHITLLMMKRIMEIMGAELIWAPGVTLCDGIAYEYAEKHKIIKASHDFEMDIIACAQNISKRYRGSRRRSETLEQIALVLFDSMKKVHGLSERERLLLRLSTILHDCGKYISMANLGECSYSIIMATEMIGLSHREREIVANVVKYNHLDFDYEKEALSDSKLNATYLTVAKLTAILRLANGLDRSHKQKFRNIKVALKEEQLVITVDTAEDITLERGLVENRAEFFREVFNVRPVIKQKRQSL